MRLQVRLFAALADQAGASEIEIEWESGSVEELKASIQAAYPNLASRLETCRVAVDCQFCQPEDPVALGQEVALIPPVSGGAR